MTHGLTVDAVDLDLLTEALSQGDGVVEWYFHPDTGDVRPGGDWSDGFDDDDLDDQGWVPIDPTPSRTGYEDMETFAAAVGDVRARDVLHRALEGKGAFRRFRDTLREFPELRDSWHGWQDAREQARAVRWLLAGGYVADDDAEAHLADCRSRGDEALAEVRAAGGPTCEMADVPTQWAEIAAALDRGDSVALTRGGRPVASITPYDTPI